MRTQFKLLFAGLSVVALAAGQAQAQEAPAEPEAARSGGIGEIVVTAQKKAENLQTVPIAVTALNSAALDRTISPDLKALNGSVPSLVVTSVVNSGLVAAVSIRGIGVQEADGFLDPAVGTVVDGVYQGSNTTALLDLFDIEQIEVLRGPQGTIFGANTIGGVINVTTKKPDVDDFAVAGKVTVGNYGRADAMAAVNVPLIEGALGMRLTAMHKGVDGFYRSTADGRRLGGQNVNAGRLAFRYESGDFDATLTTELARGRNDGPVVVNYSTPGIVSTDPDVPSIPGMPTYVEGESHSLNDPISFRVGGKKGYSDFNVFGTTLAMNYDAGPVQLTSITNYRKFKLDEYTDQDGTTQEIFDTRRVTKNWQFSQELRGTVNPTDNTELLFGGYYLTKNYKLDQDGMYLFAGDYRGLLLNDQDDKSIALFAQGYINVTDALKLTAGVRWTDQKKTMAIANRSYIFGDYTGPWVPQKASASWSHWGWRLGLDYRITNDHFFYVSYVRGAHSGGFSGRTVVLEPYGPEKVDTIEAGIKTSWFDRRLQFNLSAFTTTYNDLQVDTLSYLDNVSISTIVNAGKAKIDGIEAELTLVPIDGLTLSGNLSYLDARYKEFMCDADGQAALPEDFVDCTHLKLRNAPKLQTGARATYEFALAGGKATLFGGWSHTSVRHTDTRNALVGRVPKLDLFDASVKWEPEDGRWNVSLWGKNLSNEKYRASGYFAAQAGTAGFENFVVLGAPREWGVTFGFEF